MPFYIHRVKASAVWKWLPHLFGWYMRLLIELADSERPGYLPNDPVRLCELANGWGDDSSSRPRNWKDTASKFASAWASILRFKFQTTADGQWIFNARMLGTVETQTKKLTKSRKPIEEDDPLSLFPGISFSLIKDEDLNLCAARTFKFYADKIGADPRYKLTAERRTKYKARLVECLKETKGDLAAAEAMTREAIEKLAASAWHVDNGHTRFDDHLFHSAKVFQDRLTMKPAPLTQVQKDAKVGYAGETKEVDWAELSEEERYAWADVFWHRRGKDIDQVPEHMRPYVKKVKGAIA